jgi:hypothetical protein
MGNCLPSPGRGASECHDAAWTGLAVKIISRAEFMKLPPGTIFAKGKMAYFETPCVKGDTLFDFDGKPTDFNDTQLVAFENRTSEEFFDRFEEMVATGKSYPMNDDYGRDGCFDDQDLFLIYEPADLERLIEHARNAIEVAKVPA